MLNVQMEPTFANSTKAPKLPSKQSLERSPQLFATLGVLNAPTPTQKPVSHAKTDTPSKVVLVFLVLLPARPARQEMKPNV